MDVEVRNLTKRYTLKGSPAVADVSFVAPAGAVTSLLGPSGSGKTTVLRCIAGLEPVREGKIVFGGQDVTHAPPRERGIGFVFQSFALFPNMTVRGNVAFGLEIRGQSPEQVKARVDEVLALVQLDHLAERFPIELSGGQRQRVGFARALAPGPKVLLLDEPFAILDPRVREELRAFLRELHHKVPLTTLLVTHDQEEALELSDQIVVMDHGRAHQVGSPREIYEAPKTPFVASFVGSANVLMGHVGDGGHATLGGMRMVAPEGAAPGAAVRAIVRPHDVKLRRIEGDDGGEHHDGDGPVAVAHVQRLVTLGPDIKLELTLPSGDAVTVMLSRPELESLGVGTGDRVFVDLRAAKVFLDDYAI